VIAVSRFTIVRSAPDNTGAIGSSTCFGSATSWSASGAPDETSPGSVSKVSGNCTSPANAKVTACPLPRSPRATTFAVVVVLGEVAAAAADVVAARTSARSGASLPSRCDEMSAATPITTSDTRPAIAYRRTSTA